MAAHAKHIKRTPHRAAAAIGRAMPNIFSTHPNGVGATMHKPQYCICIYVSAPVKFMRACTNPEGTYASMPKP